MIQMKFFLTNLVFNCCSWSSKSNPTTMLIHNTGICINAAMEEARTSMLSWCCPQIECHPGKDVVPPFIDNFRLSNRTIISTAVGFFSKKMIGFWKMSSEFPLGERDSPS